MFVDWGQPSLSADENAGNGVRLSLSEGDEGASLSPKEDEKDVHVSWGDAGDAAGLTDGLGADAREFLSGFDG